MMLPAAPLAAANLPVDGVVTSGVGWRVDPFGSGKMAFHRGIDIAVPVGTPVRATGKGTVVFAGTRRGYGLAVIVQHPDGGRALYGHNSQLRVVQGEQVEPGTVVALSGNTGRSTGPHVHYELIPGGRPAAVEVAVAEQEKREAVGSNERYLLEQKLEESLDSILKAIRSGANGQGG